MHQHLSNVDSIHQSLNLTSWIMPEGKSLTLPSPSSGVLVCSTSGINERAASQPGTLGPLPGNAGYSGQGARGAGQCGPAPRGVWLRPQEWWAPLLFGGESSPISGGSQTLWPKDFWEDSDQFHLPHSVDEWVYCDLWIYYVWGSVLEVGIRWWTDRLGSFRTVLLKIGYT